MSNIKDLLNRVSNIVENSDVGTLTEIKNISDILEVNGKVATVLHFVNKDGDWNPHTLTLLEDILDEKTLSENTNQQKIDFYLLNYLDKNWKDLTIEHIKNYNEMNFFNVWMRQITSKIIRDVELLGLYPEDKSDFIYNKNFPKDGSVHHIVSDWITTLIRKIKPGYRPISQTKNQTLS